jgi:hypothetical protein
VTPIIRHRDQGILFLACGGYERVECSRRRGTDSAVANKVQRKGNESSKQDASSIMMTSIWGVGLIGLLLLFFGVLVGSTWTIQAVNRQYRRLAIERRELNEWRLELQQTNVRCARCGHLIVSCVADNTEDEQDQRDNMW